MTTLISRGSLWILLCGFLAAPAWMSAAASIVLPGHPVPHERQVFEEMDADHDGKVTESEFVSFELRRRFASADVNKDGRLSRDEYVASIKNEVGERQANAEWKMINGGKEFITIDELVHNGAATKEVSAEFKELDRGGQGFITMTEWTTGKSRGKRPAPSR
jgi:hypothetical protein